MDTGDVEGCEASEQVQASAVSDQYPRLQRWHIKQKDDKLNDDEAMWAGFPILPELPHPLSGKELAINQPLFWHRSEDEN